jgi:very-short-patch-repair endonuclease
VDPALTAALRRGRGLVRRIDVMGVAPRWALDNACRAGALRRVLPGVYVDPARAADRHLWLRAALAYAGDRAALSHTTALAVWGLGAPDGPIHLTVPRDVRLRPGQGVVVHHHHEPAPAVVRRGLAVVSLEEALVGSWPLLRIVDRHDPVIRAVGARLTTPARLTVALATASRLPDRAALRELLDRLRGGCRSALEIWGHDHVFTGPDLPVFRRQHPVRLGLRTIYLDIYADGARVAFELDGAAYHGDAVQRERDLRRDAALFAQHRITTVRYSHRRLTGEPDAVRQEIRAILGDPDPVSRAKRAGSHG